MATTKSLSENRNLLVFHLGSRFVKDHEEAMRHYTTEQQIELTEHLLLMVDEIEAYAQKPEDETIHKGFRDRENKLLKKYRKLLRPYLDPQFWRYFYFESILADKDIVTTEEYNAMETQELQVKEIAGFAFLCRNGLSHYRQMLYLNTEPEITNNTNAQTTIEGISNFSANEEADKEATQARQLLAIYYLLKVGFNVVPREKHPVSEIARLAHLLTGTKMKTINQSELYKKLLKMPTLKKGIPLVKDLLYIRSYFELAGLEKVLQEVNVDLKEVIETLPHFERAQFKDY
jgi:hypothetical protein